MLKNGFESKSHYINHFNKMPTIVIQFQVGYK